MRSIRHLTRLPILLVLAASGCGGWFSHVFAPDGASVRIEGLGEAPAAIDAELPFGAYYSTDADQSIYLSDVPLDTLLTGNVRDGQFLHAQLLWVPKPGETPVDETATNVTLRYVVVSDGKVGIYGGAGFAWPRGTPGKDNLSLVIEGSSLSLLAKTDGFVDLLTPAQLLGTISAPPDADAARRFRRGLSQLVTDAFNASRWVGRDQRTLTADEVVAMVFPTAPVTIR